MSIEVLFKKKSGKKFFQKIPLYIILLFCIGCSGTQSSQSKGVWYELQPGDTLGVVSERFGVEQLTIQQENEIYDPGDLTVGMRIFIPGVHSVRVQRQAPIREVPSHKIVIEGIPDNKIVKRTQPSPRVTHRKKGAKPLMWPSMGTISSGFGMRHGRMHLGIDITRDGGYDIRAAASGKVVFSGRKSGYGKCIIIDHGRGLRTLYAHNRTNYVGRGQRVKKGSIIAKMGRTGRVTGIHLHFEVQVNGKQQNPLRYLPIR